MGNRSRPPSRPHPPPPSMPCDRWSMRSLTLVIALLCAIVPSIGASALAVESADIDKIHESLNYLASVGIQCTSLPETISSSDLLFESHHRLLQEESIEGEGGEEFHGGDFDFYLLNGGMAALCVTFAALAAGLTMGMLSLDPLMLLIKIRAGATKAEREQAAVLLPLVQQHHRLLVSLLLLNACANEALPLFLDKLVPSYVAVILSVTLVLFFGEIIPSAIFTGPKQLTIAANLVPLVRLIMLVLSPLAWPIAKLLDHLLHDEDDSHGMNLYNRGELTALVRIQYEERMATKKHRKAEMAKLKQDGSLRYASPGTSLRSSDGVDSLTLRSIKHGLEARYAENNETFRPEATGTRHGLLRAPSWHHDEVTLVEGALSMKSKKAIDCYTPMRDVYAIPHDMILNEANVVNIYSKGYSRVPVYDPKKSVIKEGKVEKLAICGILITKQLIVVNTSDKRVVSTMPLMQPFCISPSTNLVDLINMFQAAGTDAAKGGHMAFLCGNPNKGNAALERGEPIPSSAGMMGVITLEDVLEELLQEEILDELDKKELEAMRRAQWAVTKWKRFIKKKKIDNGITKVDDAASSSQNSGGGFYALVGKVVALAGKSNAGSDRTHGSDIESGANDSAPLLAKDGIDGNEEYIYGSSG